MRRACILVLLLGCTRATPDVRKDPVPPPVAPATLAIDAKYVDAMKEVFRDYKSWSRVDDMARWAPFDCRAPPPARVAFSDAGAGPHTRKIYSLYARERQDYFALGKDAGVPSNKPQAIVKESYVAERVDAIPKSLPHGFDPYVKDGDEIWKAGDVAAVFVMLEHADGWIYGTMSPSGEVTSAGQLAPCIGCHEKAPYKPLFGPRPIHY